MVLPRSDAFPGESRVPILLPAIIVPHILTFLFMIARMVSRIYIMKIWGWDDSLIILAWLNSLASMILFAISTSYGQGHHIYDIPKPLLPKLFEILLVPFLNYQLSLCLTKLSILAFYLRVFLGACEKRVTRVTIVLVLAFSIPLFLCSVLQCSPASGKLDFNPSIKCVDYRLVVKASASLHTIADAWIILMVIPVLSVLKIPRRQKYALIGVLSLGIFVIVTAIARVATLMRNVDNPDVTWIMTDVSIWTPRYSQPENQAPYIRPREASGGTTRW